MARPEITAVNHYNVFPFNHGGSLGIRGLYKALSEWFDVNIITFVTEDLYPAQVAISSHVRVVPVVLPEELVRLQYAMYHEYGMGTDTLVDSSPAVVRWYHRFPELVGRVREIAEKSVVVLAEHVFTWRLVKAACSDKPLWYRANNVEYDYKRTTWNKIGCPQDLLQETFDIEKECCMECGCVLTVSQQESDRFMALYELPEEMREKFINIQSGYDTDNLDAVLPSRREKVSEKYTCTGFFITSYTPYGQRAAENCIAIAEKCSEIQVIIAGTVCRVLWDRQLPTNVVLAGVVSDEEKIYYLQHCDFALNLLEEGAGINVKMFEYFAFGIPVITTAYGARGILLEGGRECMIVKEGGGADAVREFGRMSLEEKDCMARNALQLLEDRYSWRSIGRRVAEEMERICAVKFLHSALPLKEIALYSFPGTESCLPKRDFYIRCAGDYGKRCLEYLRRKGLEPRAFVDEDVSKQGSTERGVPIISLAQFLEEQSDEEIVVAACGLLLDVSAELLRSGVSMEKIFLSWDISGERIMRLSNLEGCRPHYNDAEKWRKAIVERAEYRRTSGRI